ncbi:PREDICTED: crocetin glucosyltransferase 3-like [Nelumbo nucifera]|uniref:Glycosyltransferase n=2 Tax=Nelumbo nucifera TaxID=4432 RepID=A0A822ZB26_NELNU|nr:PREDICTED: crocetin glucosyltransferase 3-like [Nelumbo nucifera]DAD42322.1 TPA_asm: hypothetical protein HUJ06_000552 [Nelumbo nucifera]
MNGNGKNVVLFPFMAQGHLNPFLDLARLFAFRAPSLTITFVSTPANNLSLRPRFLSYPTIRFLDLSFHIDGDPPLPDNAENTDVFTTQSYISRFYLGSESLFRHSFHRLISQITESDGGRPPVCIISDMFLAWTIDFAHSFGSLHIPLYTSGPYAMSIYNSIWTHLPHTLTCSDVFTLPDVPGITLHRTQLSNNMKAASKDKRSSEFVKRQADCCRRSDGSLWNTVEVLEKSSLHNWAQSTGKPVWAIGPLLPRSCDEHERGGKRPGLSPEACIEWLNLHPPNSVLYVSFGSQNSVTVAQMKELANGLEQSGRPFIWALRNPTGFDGRESFREEWLPDGFQERMKDSKHGLLVHNWAPQIDILSHTSTGAFLSHCGWNSVLESLGRGVPIIGWPLAAEQFYNSKLLEEELGACMELARGSDAIVEGGDVARIVRLVMEGEEGEEMRRKAKGLREEMKMAVMEGDGQRGSSLRAFDDFVETLILRCDKSEKPERE